MCKFSHDHTVTSHLEETTMHLEEIGRYKRAIEILRQEVAAWRDAHDDEHYAPKLGCIVHRNAPSHPMEESEGL